MALIDVRPVFFPALDLAASNGGNPTAEASFLLDASGEKFAWVFRAQKTGTLAKVRFRTGTVTTGDTMKVSFQDVDATTGNPDETVDQYRTIVIADADDNTNKLTGILSSDGTDTGTKRAVTRGDRIAVVTEFDAFVAGNLNLVGRQAVAPGNVVGDHYSVLKAGAGPTWTKSSTPPRIAVEYDDGTYAYAYGIDPFVNGIAVESFNSGTNPDERGNRITVPMPAKAIGLWAWVDADAACDLVLYDTDGTTALATVSLDSDIRASTIYLPFVAYFASDITLAKDGAYRVAVKPTTTTNVAIAVGDAVANAVLGASAGGVNTQYTARVDAGAWSQTDSKQALCGLILGSLDDGVSTGGGPRQQPQWRWHARQ